MKALILAGGRGMRLLERADLYPLSVVEICGRPIIRRIMRIYSHMNTLMISPGFKGAATNGTSSIGEAACRRSFGSIW